MTIMQQNDRVDNIIAGTVEGVSGAEIVDARDGETVLLNKLQKMNFGEVGKKYKNCCWCY